MPNNYSEATKWLFEQFPSYQLVGASAYKPTLDNTNRLLEVLDVDPSKLRFIHVAGSNGKGTVSSILASVFKEAGYTTGLFTSPHIKEFTERIRVNGTMISRSEVIDFVDKIKCAKLDFNPSFFEISFVMALDHFDRNNCDVCVIETGLGGRLDATNVIHPLLSIITTISLEHTQFLGNDLASIAAEKAGIIKPETPVVIGEGAMHQQSVFKKIAKENNAELILVSRKMANMGIKTPFLEGSYQEENLRTALQSLDSLKDMGFKIPESSIQNGLIHLKANSGYQARLQIISRDPLIIIDACHNLEGIEATLKAVSGINKGVLHLIYGTSADKDVKGISELFPENSKLYLTEFNNERCMKTAVLKVIFYRKNFGSVSYYSEPEKAMKDAIKNYEPKDTILVFGSFFLLEHFF